MKRLVTIAAIAVNTFCFGQFYAGFEASQGYVGSAGGTVVEGQNGWYNPIEGSAPGLVFNYSNNAIGVVKHPSFNQSGTNRFLATVTNPAAAAIVSRAQRDISFGPGQWQASYDFCPIWNGQPPSEDSLGSFSLQPSLTANYFQTLCRWPDFNNPTIFTMDFGVSDANGLPSGTPISTYRNAGPAWSNLPVNHWYRCSMTWDFLSNRVVSVSIQDLTTLGPRTTYNPPDWYLAGGSANVRGRETPTAFRLFSGGTSNGNAVGYDNLAVGKATSIDTLAPVSEQIVFGTTNSGGNLASWAADDNDGRKICRFFVPDDGTVTRVNVSYTTTKVSATNIVAKVKVSAHTPGSQLLTIAVENKRTNNFDFTNVQFAQIQNGKTYFAVPPGNPSDYIGVDGKMRTQIRTTQLYGGIRNLTFPCITYEFAQLEVSGT